MTQTEIAAAIEATRAILNDPERVVLDPAHYVEISESGEIEEPGYLLAAHRRANCRVCFAGAAVVAAIECMPTFVDDHAVDVRRGHLNDNLPVLTELEAAARELGIVAEERYGDHAVGVLTAALTDGRVNEVCDLALRNLAVPA